MTNVLFLTITIPSLMGIYKKKEKDYYTMILLNKKYRICCKNKVSILSNESVLFYVICQE